MSRGLGVTERVLSLQLSLLLTGHRRLGSCLPATGLSAAIWQTYMDFVFCRFQAATHTHNFSNPFDPSRLKPCSKTKQKLNQACQHCRQGSSKAKLRFCTLPVVMFNSSFTQNPLEPLIIPKSYSFVSRTWDGSCNWHASPHTAAQPFIVNSDR